MNNKQENDSVIEKSNSKESKSNEFGALGLNRQVLKGIEEAGFVIPSPIQLKAIPPILEGRDIIAQAQTGTGKTAAFALPIINNLKNDKSIEALVITPTRELAMQISDEIFKLGKFLRVKTVCLYGKQSIKIQIDLINKNPQVIIATPGRLLDHLKNNRIKNFNPSFVVLDEGDEMLDMGFIDDIDEIFHYIKNKRQTMLFSATMPPIIQSLAKKILNDPFHIKVTNSNVANSDIFQRYYIINEHERNDAIIRLFEVENPKKSIIFTRTKREADELNEFLNNNNYKSVALHGDMEQRCRNASMSAFKNNKHKILVATDVAARGLDITDISHVINYHMPLNTESYVHRIGRTGRAGKKGTAITLVTPLEYKELKKIQSDINTKLELYEIPDVDNDVLINKILRTDISNNAISFHEMIGNRADNTQVLLKLLSIYLEENKKIGLSKNEFQDLEQKNQKKSTFHNGKTSSRTRINNGKSRPRSREVEGNKEFKKEDSRRENKREYSLNQGYQRKKFN